MTIKTKRLKNGKFLVRATQGIFSTACANKSKKKAFNGAVRGINGLMGYPL